VIEKVEIYFDYFYLKAPKLQTSESRVYYRKIILKKFNKVNLKKEKLENF